MPFKNKETYNAYMKEKMRQIREKKYKFQDDNSSVIPIEAPKKPVVIVHRDRKIMKKRGLTDDECVVIPKSPPPMTITLLDGRVLPLRRRISL